MSHKLTIFITVAVFCQLNAQFIGNPLNPGYPNQPTTFPFGHNFAGPTNPGPATGGGFTVTSSSPIAPTGVSVLAENLAIEGGLSVGGQLPFLGTVGLEGTLPAYGSGAVSYGCGNGNVGITSDGLGSGGTALYSLAGQNFGPNSPTFGPTGSFGLNPTGFGPGYGPSLGSNGPSFGPSLGPGFTGPL